MKLVRSDSPDVVHDITSALTRTNRYGPIFLLGLLPNLLILSISALCLLISVRTAVGFGLPAFLAWNAWVIWRTRSPRLSWVIKTRGERIYARLFVGFGKAWKRMDTPDVVIFEASDIASISIRTIEVFLYGPKPHIVEWLVIEPTQEVAASISDQIPSFLLDRTAPRVGERVYWDNEAQQLAIGWKMCRPALRTFIGQIARECPSIVIAPEEHSELDLNGIWRGISLNLGPQKRQIVAQAMQLGFGCECKRLLSRYKYISYQKAAAYLAEIYREEAGTETPCCSA